MSELRRVVRFAVLVAAVAAVGATATPLRISLPPVLESLPIAFAESWGMFDDAGLDVDVVGITDNQERSTALLTGNLDAVLADLTTAVLDYCTSRSVVVVSSAASTPPAGGLRLALVSHLGFGPSSLADLIANDQYIAVTYCTDEEYLLDQLLAANKLPRAWLTRYTYFSDTLQVAVWFGAKTMPVAVLLEPYYSYIRTLIPVSGVPAQLVVLSDFSDLQATPRVLVFRSDVLARRSADVATFLRVYDEAVKRMNTTPRDEIINVGLDVVIGLFFEGANRATVQQQTLDAISIPTFDAPGSLSRETFDSMTDWMHRKGYTSGSVTFEEFTRFDLLP